MCNFDWSALDDCCAPFLQTYGNYENLTSDVNEKMNQQCQAPKCNEFFYSRMPKDFEWCDKGICVLYLINYLINFFIS